MVRKFEPDYCIGHMFNDLEATWIKKKIENIQSCIENEDTQRYTQFTIKVKERYTYKCTSTGSMLVFFLKRVYKKISSSLNFRFGHC